jgi:hypothetical protein
MRSADRHLSMRVAEVRRRLLTYSRGRQSSDEFATSAHLTTSIWIKTGLVWQARKWSEADTYGDTKEPP